MSPADPPAPAPALAVLAPPPDAPPTAGIEPSEDEVEDEGPEPAGPPPGDGWARRASAWPWFPPAVYLASRALLLGLAVVVTALRHEQLAQALSAFDGAWYLRTVAHWYPHRVLRTQSTLGFMPLYPVVIWLVAKLLLVSALVAALLVSSIGGLVATFLVWRLAGRWWGPEAAAKAVLVFCLFPGSIVFSMVYAEGVLVPLAVGCLLALATRRWVLAGLLASLAATVEPVGLVMIPVCLWAAWRELRGPGTEEPAPARRPASRRVLVAPLLSVLGIAGYASFLWAWTGTPLATYLAQADGWHQRGTPFQLIGHALVVFVRELERISRTHHVPHLASLNLNLVNGLVGAVFLVLALVALHRHRRTLTPGTGVWAGGIALLTFWSIRTPPNARMLIAAFPAVLIWARHLAGRRFGWFLAGETVLFVAMSAATFALLMRP
ncbi:hypothetical protein [Aciditerrimonas ferrireducens]|uniref:hypothetical protein n=1 Tax=Aciditerrimonas ferrireducens TaxID=667306 RepID=UPI002003F241|nr:hypothetical protein [Aciditerrimonas ferrireducens]MCK4177093.1 hypothetical protein [Aciditerrimonas ferrireducens]